MTQAQADDNQNQVIEAVDSVCESLIDTGAKVDRENNVIRGVKVIGVSSKNGRDYPEPVLKESLDRYEGVRVNIDHPEKPSSSRKVGDRFGKLENANYRAGQNPGIYADLKYNPKHTLAEQVLWDADNDPGAVGLSHNAGVRISQGHGGRKTVESIDSVRSVDLVADPATTDGIFEGIDPEATEGILADKAKADRIIGAASDLLSELRYLHGSGAGLDPTQQASKAVSIARDLISEFETSNETESADMDLSELTIEQLRESRPDLVQAIEATQAEALTQVTEERDTLLGEKQAAEHAALVESEIKAAKLDPSNKRQVSDVFRETLLSMESKEQRNAAIADRAQLVLESNIGNGNQQPGKPTHQKPVTSGFHASPVSELTTESIANCF